ncbi:hypothetical protein [uncultured Kordia sp.]|uniref:hypothetical protein n=1 Tax=uncultured Kordia sp. TaxID=507699 RepID=UPI00260DA8E4|nr:hypothetical protein [uncultured Kordia sp.]
MKKQQFKSLQLNKKSISSLQESSVKGGTFITLISCPGVGICAPTGGGSNNTCPPPPLTNGCPTISCDDVGICAR